MANQGPSLSKPLLAAGLVLTSSVALSACFFKMKRDEDYDPLLSSPTPIERSVSFSTLRRSDTALSDLAKEQKVDISEIKRKRAKIEHLWQAFQRTQYRTPEFQPDYRNVLTDAVLHPYLLKP
ncbi:hypothetical protein OAO01_09640, partial [Oligoflexia bacterium]|nr:hypothetical protein [Oligoflexia bacterium]